MYTYAHTDYYIIPQNSCHSTLSCVKFTKLCRRAKHTNTNGQYQQIILFVSHELYTKLPIGPYANKELNKRNIICHQQRRAPGISSYTMKSLGWKDMRYDCK